MYACITYMSGRMTGTAVNEKLWTRDFMKMTLDIYQFALFIVFLTGVARSQNTTSTITQDAVQSSGTGCNSEVVAAEAQGASGSNTDTGTKLWCYECYELYKTKYDPLDSPCKNNLSQIAIRQCGVRDRYCKVETLHLSNDMIEIHRGCSELCLYGCRFNGYGLTYRRCYSCCRDYACNEGNSAPGTVRISIPLVNIAVSWVLLSTWKISKLLTGAFIE